MSLKHNTTIINSAIAVLVAGLFIFYANLIYYNTSPITITQGETILDTTFSQSIPILSILMTWALYAVAIYILFVAGKKLMKLDTSDNKMWWLAPIFVLIIGAVFYASVYNHAWILTRPMGGMTDAYVLQYESAKSLLHFQNPYTVDYTNQILQNVPSYYRTYIEVNTFVHNIDYPAFSFIYYIPSALLHISGIFQDLLLLAVTSYLVYRKSPQSLKWFFPVFLFLNYIYILFPSSSITDVCWVCFIIIALLYRDKLWFSSILMGLAASYKEETLVILPLFLIIILKEMGIKNFYKYLLTIVCTVAIVNIPFLIMNPRIFIEDILMPITSNTPTGGMGLSGISLAIPRYVYSGLFASTIVVGTYLYWKRFDLLKISGISIIPMIAFWFNARSFQNYLMWFPLLTVVLLITQAKLKVIEETTK